VRARFALDALDRLKALGVSCTRRHERHGSLGRWVGQRWERRHARREKNTLGKHRGVRKKNGGAHLDGVVRYMKGSYETKPEDDVQCNADFVPPYCEEVAMQP
jgi:hypothetical protein